MTSVTRPKFLTIAVIALSLVTMSGCVGASSANQSSTVGGGGTGGSGGTSSHTVDLSWNASSSQVVGYNVYRGSQSGGPYSMVNPVLEASTTFTDSNVASGQTYYYVVTSVDSSSHESAYSNEAPAAVP